jgi:sigma-B regulation protein RsbU (phosphoserine phosphatase)
MNDMMKGLLERDKMQQSLSLAKEVQQALLPSKRTEIPGLEIAAKIMYCDETGGDYYDFFSLGGGDAPKAGILVGDVSGHGIPAALLMASARAFFRQRSEMPGDISSIVSDVNRHLAADVRDSGSFMTLFYLMVDVTNRRLEWVRAGHDPAILYDPASGRFEELKGSGIALGVDDTYVFKANKKEGLKRNQIILLTTDGIWEAQNNKGERFGKEPLFRIIRDYAKIDAHGILTTCLFTLEKFRDGMKAEDDATLIVVKTTG